MLRLHTGTVIPDSETRGATFDGDGLTTLPDGRQFRPAHLIDTGVPCPACKAEGKTNNGGKTPTLRQREDNGVVGCVTHDGATVTGMREVTTDARV